VSFFVCFAWLLLRWLDLFFFPFCVIFELSFCFVGNFPSLFLTECFVFQLGFPLLFSLVVGSEGNSFAAKLLYVYACLLLTPYWLLPDLRLIHRLLFPVWLSPCVSSFGCFFQFVFCFFADYAGFRLSFSLCFVRCCIWLW